MIKIVKIIIIIFIFFGQTHYLFSSENFYEEGKKNFDDKEYVSSKFLFQRNIVFNPKDAKSYLYLAKIFNYEKNQKEEEKNLNTTILLDPNNEEAVYMLIEIELKKSNYLEVKKLTETFLKICNNLCKKEPDIKKSLKNIEPKNESK